jgi:hypothetical protein
MGMIWWILPAVAAVIGIMLGFAGVSKLVRMKPIAGGARLLFGTGFLGLAGVVSFAGLNLQTYKRLTHERPVADISFDAVAGETNTYVATLQLNEEEEKRTYTLKGDEFEIGAKVIKFQPMSNMLGYDSIYRLDFLEGRLADRYTAAQVTEAVSTGVALTDNPGLDIAAYARTQGTKFGVQDAKYGSGVYNPMDDGLAYEIWITQDALIARPSNTRTKLRLGVGEHADAVAGTDETTADESEN